MVSKEQFIADIIQLQKERKEKKRKAKIDIDNFLIGNRLDYNSKWKYNNKLLLHK